ncbi:MAG TPA: PepSY-associated TM helix domain-containing protein [Allosphingosinicella sp.]|jgi:uncharacterized iron-regulated membrane protein
MFNKVSLRRLWFQVHKWLGLTLAILIIPISLTGSALVWHDWLDGVLNPQREVNAPPALTPAAYAAAAAKLAAPDERLLSIGFPHENGAVVATLTKPAPPGGGRPLRTTLYLHPTDARLLDRVAGGTGAVQVMHVIHGSLMVPGMGRQIVGWIGVAMLLSSLTGLWLWWPLKGGFKRGLRWRRQPETSGNLHHLGGFWIALPLAVLSFTGAWISFPAFFASLSGDPAGPSPAERMRRMAAAPMAQTQLTPDAALGAAQPLATGRLVTLAWPTEKESKWKLAFAREGGNAEVQVDDATRAATPPKPPQPETTARLMRRIHDGNGMGPVWQTIVFIGGIIPAALAVTGILMWLTARRRRREMEGRRTSRAASTG